MSEEIPFLQSTILLAHPEKSILDSYEIIVKESGHNILSTSNIDNFDSEAFHHPIDILLIDDSFTKDALNTYIGMLSFTFPTIKIAMFCESIDMELLHFYNRLEVFTFLAKPLDEKKLLDFISTQSIGALPLDAIELIKRAEGLEHAFNDSYIISKASKDGIITSVNQNFCDLTGYDEEDLIGAKYSIISHPDTTQSFKEELWDTILAKKIYRKRILNRTKLDDDFTVDITIIPILNDYDEVIEFLCLMQDVTDMISLNKHMIAEKNAHMEELASTKDRYLQVFSHELKTPLNSVINFSSYVCKQLSKSDCPNKEKLIESLHLVEQSGSEISDMVTSLLDLSKIKDGNLPLSIHKCHLGDIVKHLKDRFEFAISQDNITVNYNFDETLSIECDCDKLLQICSALFSNAVKYGNGEILFQMSVNDDNFDIVIEDNGSGIEDKESVVELFVQGDSDSMTRESKGTGIGLHFTSMLVELMGYHLLITDSEELCGAKVVCSGPVKKGNK
jgi:PAS domain S-box-containing protein